jgi:hypothetical protein
MAELRNKIGFHIPVKINDFLVETKDISPRGLNVHFKNSNFVLHEQVNIEINYFDCIFLLEAEIIQVTSEGVSVAFRNLNRDDDKLLNLFF